MPRYRLSVNPADPASCEIIRDDANGAPLIDVLMEKLKYNQSRALAYWDSAMETIDEIQHEIRNRRANSRGGSRNSRIDGRGGARID